MIRRLKTVILSGDGPDGAVDSDRGVGRRSRGRGVLGEA
ncbi:hypothetical protein SEA_JOURNEY13_57 [Mycobacterium phage Journey13]|nr:hypothetical protein SEA_JOURNEY13_57 [Mycobacterium phage Journey13]